MNDFYVIVDAGHGGTSLGTGGNGFFEKDLNLKISKYMYERFKELGIPVALTRSIDETLSKEERLRRINNAYGKDEDVILISNHLNTSQTPNTAEGAEVIYALRNEETLAKNVLNALSNAGQITRGIYQKRLDENPNLDYYFIHRETNKNIEPIIIEYGFINNSTDVKRITENYRKYVDAVVNAVIDTRRGKNVSKEQKDIHIVRPGDNLYNIAKMHDISVDELKKMNNLESDIISIGQVLKVAKKVINSKIEYIVKEGDTLYKIAKDFEIGVDELKKANGLLTDIILIGQILTIPKNENNRNKTIEFRTPFIYKVKKGDTMYQIAKNYKTTVNKIIEMNNLDHDYLIVGQLIMIP